MPAAMAQLPLTEYQPALQGRLVSYSEPVSGIDPLHFLRLGEGRARFYWRDGRSGMTLAGMGIAADLMGWGETRFAGIERQARELFAHAALFNASEPLARPRLFGGFAFREDFVPDQTWFGFNPAHFVLPHYQLVCHGKAAWLTINTLLPLDEDPVENQGQLQEALHAWKQAPDLGPHAPILLPSMPNNTRQAEQDVQLNYPMRYAAWSQLIEEALAAFRQGELKKVVLARICEARLPQMVDIDGALAFLSARYADCFCFLFEPRPHHAFFGATPELLVATQGRQVTSMALAGSIQRGATPTQDEVLAQTLLDSAKDRHEHALVVEALRQRLAPWVCELTLPDAPTIYRLRNIQHLYTPVEGVLRKATGVLPLVQTLHPTPALGGSPRAQALRFIQEREPVLRGWYAAPIGWIDSQMDGAFGVAIRSAVAQKQRVWMYAGAGIVADSDPQKEWEETDWKFRPIQEALGIK